MLIKKLRFQNFKRFADLTIDLDPENTGKAPKLVLLIGANGSGKSCVFDGLYHLSSKSNLIYANKNDFIIKNPEKERAILETEFYQDNKLKGATNSLIKWSEEDKNRHSKIINDTYHAQFGGDDFDFYGRTAFRHLPEITKTQIGGSSDVLNLRSVDYDYERSYVDMDLYFNKLLEQIQTGKGNISTEFESQLQIAFKNIFGETKTSLRFIKATGPVQSEDGKPAIPINFLFEKNGSEIGFTNLSAGEKQIFLVLFNLFNREIHTAKDKIIYFDELDAHLNTSLQKNLLKEITENWILEGSQLWVASHSLGFIEYAREYEKGAIIDLDNLDFDDEQILYPVDKKDPNKQFLNVALGETFLKTLLKEVEDKYKDQVLIYSEGNNSQYLEYAKSLFAPKLKVKFLDGGGKDNLKAIFHQLKDSKNRFLFIFDCDAEAEFNSCNSTKSNSKAILIPKNPENQELPNGIENLFDATFFDDNSDYYDRRKINGTTTISLNKAKFFEFIMNRKNPDDFEKFKSVIEEIESLLNQKK